MKQCTTCGQIKSLDGFYVNKATKDGYSYPCKECCKKQVKEYSEKNPEKVMENIKRWQKKHPEKLKNAHARWRERNREEERERAKMNYRKDI